MKQPCKEQILQLTEKTRSFIWQQIHNDSKETWLQWAQSCAAVERLSPGKGSVTGQDAYPEYRMRFSEWKQIACTSAAWPLNTNLGFGAGLLIWPRKSTNQCNVCATWWFEGLKACFSVIKAPWVVQGVGMYTLNEIDVWTTMMKLMCGDIEIWKFLKSTKPQQQTKETNLLGFSTWQLTSAFLTPDLIYIRASLWRFVHGHAIKCGRHWWTSIVIIRYPQIAEVNVGSRCKIHVPTVF